VPSLNREIVLGQSWDGSNGENAPNMSVAIELRLGLGLGLALFQWFS